MIIAALDPGRDKCGFAALSKDSDENFCALFQKVIKTSELEQEILSAREQFHFDILVMGNGTTSKIAKNRVEKAIKDLKIEVVDEYKTTELARGEYFRENPPKGWRRFIPVTMQTPPLPVDDYVAVILGKRYLKNTLGSESNETKFEAK